MKAGSRVSFQSWSTWLSKTHSSVMILFFPLWQVLWFLKKKKMPSKYSYNKGLSHLCEYFISEYTFVLKVFPFIQPKFVMVFKYLCLFFFFLFIQLYGGVKHYFLFSVHSVLKVNVICITISFQKLFNTAIYYFFEIVC